jgi:mono/diheme cytochrome c family protein
MKVVIAVLVGVVALAAITFAFALRPRLPAAERGRRLAERTGCFACHGPGGIRGVANPGRSDRTVPNFEGDVMMYAKSPEEIHEWIHEGVTAKRARSQTWRAQRDSGALRMPAFKGRISEPQMEDLVAYVMAVSGMPEPGDLLASRGLDRIEALGCVGCHGAGGRLASRNPGSLKGYVPSWDGADFPELVRDRAEFREWVEQGVSGRFKRNPFARVFLNRAVLRMPAYERHLEPGDIDALWAYVQWLRAPGGVRAVPAQEHGQEGAHEHTEKGHGR